MRTTPSQRTTSITSSNSYCFIGALAVAAAGLLSYRKSLRRLKTTSMSPIASTHTQPSNTSPLFGGGKGVHVPAEGNPTAAIIFLHGLGDTGAGWAPFFPLDALPHVQTILPTAPTQPVTLNMGYKSHSWFDLYGLDENSQDDQPGILENVARVNAIIDHQIQNGIPSHRIIVAGFSQGGALALTTALRTHRKLAGVLALSSWLPLRTTYPAFMTHHAKDTQIFIGHGTADQVVQYRVGEKSADFLQSLDCNVTFKAYPGLTHSASVEEMEDVQHFISRLVPQT